VSDAYRNVYPHFHNFLDEGYLRVAKMMLELNQKRDNNCDHEWNKVRMHKLGELRLCKKCETFVSSLEEK
jgi:hypothetical protein